MKSLSLFIYLVVTIFFPLTIFVDFDVDRDTDGLPPDDKDEKEVNLDE